MQAMAVVGFGSADTSFSCGGEGFEMPAGTAHFIEHKLFDKKEKSAFTELSKNGASVNAFTDFARTCYYFSCQDNFYENLRTLVDMVSQPYFDEKGVESEKSIIASEINMYKDIPDRRVFSNLTKIMYPHSPLGEEIAGTEKSIEKITPEILYKCYNAFYTPENISIICCGDIEPEKAALIVQNAKFSAEGCEKNILRDNMPRLNDYVSKTLGISEPVFNVGFKYSNFDITPENTYAIKMIFDIVSGEGSKLNERLLNRQVLSEPLGFSLICTDHGSFSVVSGKSSKPAYIANSLIKTASRLKETGLNDTTLKRVRSMYCGRIIRGFNSVEAICMAQAELSKYNLTICDAERAVSAMTADKLNSLSASVFERENAYLSVVK